MKETIDSVVLSIQNAIGNTLSEEEIRSNIKLPNRHGDVAFSCHSLARAMESDDAADIADWLQKQLSLNPVYLSGAKALSGYINMDLSWEDFTRRVLQESVQSKYGSVDTHNQGLVVLDYSAPNIGKPLHIGHIRSTIIGDSMVRILQKAGYQTHGINYLGDIGLHLGKLIVAYEDHVDHAQLAAEPEKELLRLYVKFGEEHEKLVGCSKKDPSLPEDEDLEQINSPMMEKARDVLQKIESYDPHYTALLAKIHESSMQGFNRVYDLLDVSIDETTGQSKFSERGKRFCMEALDCGVAQREADGAVIVKMLERFGVPDKVILKSDGTAIYSTQDLGAAVSRFEEHQFSKMLYVVAEEQKTYFQQIFKILDLMGYSWAKDCHHLSFGMINLENVKMSSRKGNILFLEDVLKESIEYSKKLIKDEIVGSERDDIARTIGIGVIKYMVLSVDPIKPIQFSWDRALSMDANSAPYVQYAYTRSRSIIEGRDFADFDSNDLTRKEERALVKKLAMYPLAVERAARDFRPNVIANYSFELAKDFNRFYQNVRVSGSSQENSRLYLVSAVQNVLSDSLGLLGIGVPARM